MNARQALAAAAVAVLVAGFNPASASAATTHALIDGSGSSWAANAVNQWVADVATQGLQVVFTADGSAQGRKDYANRTTDMAISDIPYQGTDPTTGVPDNSQGRSLAYLPIAAGGTSFPYHIQVGHTLIRNLRLSGLTLAKIFTDQITNWNDPQVTADNNGHRLPSIPIIPVVHSEGAGTTAMFTEYLSKQFPSIWAPCNGGINAMTEYFPLNCGHGNGPQRALSGSDGVMNFITNADANGSIGIEEFSYALLANYPAAKILNSAGYYTLPTQYNVAVALTKAVINNDPNSPLYLTQNLDKVYVNPDPRTYPLSSYVYAIIPTAANDSKMTTPKRQTVADFLYYSICRGQGEIGAIGYSSLPVNLVQAGFGQIGRLKQADPGVDLTERNVSTCNNPTFIPGQPNVNHLAVIAPQPPPCDKNGAGPCGDGVGAYNGAPSGAPAANHQNQNSGSGGAGAGSGGSGGHGSGPVTSGPSGTLVTPGAGTGGGGSEGHPGVAEGQSGDPVLALASAQPEPTTLAVASHNSSTSAAAGGAVVLVVLAALAGPAVLLRRRRRT